MLIKRTADRCQVIRQDMPKDDIIEGHLENLLHNESQKIKVM